jgi:hypothetical protein
MASARPPETILLTISAFSGDAIHTVLRTAFSSLLLNRFGAAMKEIRSPAPRALETPARNMACSGSRALRARRLSSPVKP